MELRDYLNIFFRWFWLIFLGTLVAMGASYIMLRYFTPSTQYQYESTATIVIGNDELASRLGPEPLRLMQETYSEIARRRPVTQNVVEELGLPISAEDLSELIVTGTVGNTRLLEITARYNTGQGAADIANAVVVQLQQAQIQPTALTNTGGLEQTGAIFILSEAQPSETPASGPYLIIIVAGILGMGLTIGFVLLIEYFDNRIRSENDVTRNLGLPVLGVVNTQQVRTFGPLRQDAAKRRAENTHEACRWLRVNLFEARGESPRTLLITSPHALKEKSALSIGLASAWLETGEKVSLVDDHLRYTNSFADAVSNLVNGSGHLNGDESQNGHHSNGHETSGKSGSTKTKRKAKRQNQAEDNTEFILGTAVLENESTRTDGTQTKIKSPSASPLLQDKLDNLAAPTNVVIVDGPPTFPKADAAILASKVDSVLLALSLGSTDIGTAKHSVDVLQKAGGNVLGVVLLL